MMLLLIGWLIIALMMFGLWFVQRYSLNATFVDIGWAASIGLLAFLYAVQGPGLISRRMLVWFLVGCWSLRLSIYLFSNRYYGKSEDPRYKRLRERWKNNAQRNFCIFYQAQALIAVIMTVPVLLFCLDARSHLGALEIIGVVIALMAMLGEMLADYQLNQFKKSAESKGKTCRSGLWRYSRHPNYFFDWLWWSGLALMATQSPHGWVGWASPMLILWLIFKVTGIPASEAQSLLTRGEEYRQYQQQTSVFVPWFPKV